MRASVGMILSTTLIIVAAAEGTPTTAYLSTLASARNWEEIVSMFRPAPASAPSSWSKINSIDTRGWMSKAAFMVVAMAFMSSAVTSPAMWKA